MTGIVLAMHYTPHVVCAGVSIEHVMREVYGGWMIRNAHANGGVNSVFDRKTRYARRPKDEDVDYSIPDLVLLIVYG